MPNTDLENVSPRLTLVATCLGSMLVILDVTVVNVALERIQASLETSVTGLQWVVNAYTLVFASLLLTAGALGDRLGPKRVYLAGLLLFTAASLACGAASGIAELVIARLVQGVGAALCVPASLALLNASFPDAASRAKAVSLWSGAGGLALAAGPVVGGILVDGLGWPSIFFINLPLGVLGIWLTLRYAPTARVSRSRGMDIPGQLLAILALGMLTAGFVESGSRGWLHPIVISAFVIAAAASAIFLLVESRSSNPMLPLSLFRAPLMSAACLVGLLTSFSYYGLLFVFSLFFQVAKGYSPLATGLAFLPMTAVVSVTNLIAGWLTARFGPKLPMVVGQALAAAGYLLLAGTDATTSYVAIVGPLLAAGVGVALTVPSMTTAVLGSVEKQRAGIASGALNAARQMGGVVGVGVFGSLIVSNTSGVLGGMQTALVLAGVALIAGCFISLFGIQSATAKAVAVS